MKVACNASPLIWLSHTGHFTLLQDLFEVVFIAPEVRAETVERAMGYPNTETVRAGCEAGWMVVVPPNDADGIVNLMKKARRNGRRLDPFHDQSR